MAPANEQGTSDLVPQSRGTITRQQMVTAMMAAERGTSRVAASMAVGIAEQAAGFRRWHRQLGSMLPLLQPSNPVTNPDTRIPRQILGQSRQFDLPGGPPEPQALVLALMLFARELENPNERDRRKIKFKPLKEVHYLLIRYLQQLRNGLLSGEIIEYYCDPRYSVFCFKISRVA